MNKDAQSQRDLEFLQATLKEGMFPDWPTPKKKALQDLIRQDLEAKITSDIQNAPIKNPHNGHFIVFAATQELEAVVERLEAHDVSVNEQTIGKFLPAHRVKWVVGTEEATLWLCCAISQRVEGVKNLVDMITNEFKPKSILLAGMMGGIPGKVQYLEVVVPPTIYDTRFIGTKNKALTLEPEPGSVHPHVHLTLNNVTKFEFGGTIVDVIKHKKTMTVAAKQDDITHDLFTTLTGPDAENIVAYEMEGQAMVLANHYQALEGKSTILGLVKGVADFGGISIDANAKELDSIKNAIGYDEETDGPFDATTNKLVKRKLQAESTFRSFIVAAELTRRFVRIKADLV